MRHLQRNYFNMREIIGTFSILNYQIKNKFQKKQKDNFILSFCFFY